MPSEHSESLYHCVNCRQVYYLEETDRKTVDLCGNCGPTTMFRITGEELLGERAVPQEDCVE